MAGSESLSGPAGIRSSPVAMRRRSSQGIPTPPSGACGFSQMPQRSGKRARAMSRPVVTSWALFHPLAESSWAEVTHGA